eukprot:6160090-Ditylum_brightwellii.AAC.1
MSKYYYAIVTVAIVQDKRKKTQQTRKMTFTSTGLGINVFPPETEVKEPSINAAEDVAESIT